MKAILLARVSTEEQKEAGNSLPAQVLRLRKYAIEKNLVIAKELSFDESAFKTEREEFSKVVETLKTSKEPLSLCCDKIDRLIRNFTKELVTLEELRKEGKIELHFPSDNIILTKDSPATDLFRFTIGVSLAKYYSDSISDSVKRAYENKIKNGEWIGKSPIGYISTKNEDKDVIPDPERASYIIRIFEMYATGNYSLLDITKEMETMGLTGNTEVHNPLPKSMIHKIINNPFYYGVMKIKDQLYPHKYEPLISKDLFNRCQAVSLGYHKKPFHYAAKPYIFRGMITCSECGCMITPETSKGHHYYHCTNYRRLHKKVLYCKEEDLLTPIYNVLDNMKFTDDQINKITENLKSTNESKNKFHQLALDNLQKEYSQIDTRISNAFNLLADGQIPPDVFNAKLKEWKNKQADIQEEMSRHTNADENFYITASLVLNLAKRAREIFESSEVEEKKQLLSFVLQNLQLKEKELVFTVREPFNTMLKFNNCPTMLRGQDSNLRNPP